MDYHFVTGKQEQQSKRKKSIFLAFIPVFILAALLPVFLVLVRTPVGTDFSSEAKENDLTIWLTPPSVEATVGTQVEFTVMAFFESTDFLPRLVVPITTSGVRAIVENPTIDYKNPFMGQVTLGTVKVTPQQEGELLVIIDPQTVSTPLTDVSPFIAVSSATITVR